MKAKTTIKSVTYTTMKARRAAEKGLNDILEITYPTPPTLKEYDEQPDKTEKNILGRIEFVKDLIKKFLGPHPPISTMDAEKAEYLRDGKYKQLMEDETIDPFAREAIDIYMCLDCSKKEFIKSGYKVSFKQLYNLINNFEHFGGWYARRCSRAVHDHGWNDLHWGLNRKKEQKKVGTDRDKKIIQHLKKFYIQNPNASDKEAYYSISESVHYTINSAKKYFYPCKKKLNTNQK